MFDILFGWRKASKCKNMIKQLQYRLKVLKNKRRSIVKLLRDDVAQLIKSGREDIAFNRAERLFKDENTMAVYELLETFCEFIMNNMSYIRKRKDCPNDINEAVSSLIYASSRCGDLPELRLIRKLFEERYGQRFALAASELYPGNLVNRQIREKLSVKCVPDDVKLLLVDEIAKDYCLRPEILAIEYASELQQMQANSVHKLLDEDVYTCHSKSGGDQMEVLDSNKTQDIHVDSSFTSETKSTGENQSHSLSHQNSDLASASVSSYLAQQSSPDISESPVHNKAAEIRNFAQFDSSFLLAGVHAKEVPTSDRINNAFIAQKEVRRTAASSSESLSRFNEEKIVYLDDIEELQSSMTKDGDCQDQRIFKFKPSGLPRIETLESSVDEYESWSDKSSSRSSRKSVKSSVKQSRRRSMSREISTINDIECEIYYEQPRKSSASKHRSHHRREHQEKTPLEEESKQSCRCKYNQKKLWCHCHFNCQKNDCSLEHPCHYCISNEKLQRGMAKPMKVPIYDMERERFCHHFGHCHSMKSRESEEKVEKQATLSQKPGRGSCDNVANEYNVFTYTKHWTDEKIEGSQGKRALPPYSTVKSMPPERPKESHTGKSFLRCNSFPFQYPEHVHPKLPDYDDIAAKFMALKKEHLQNKG